MIEKRSTDLVGNSDKNILKVLEESNKYLESHEILSSKINESLRVFSHFLFLENSKCP